MRDRLRKIFQQIAWYSGLVAAVLFVVGVYMQDANRFLRGVWQASAIAGLVAFAIDARLRKLDERDAEALRKELAAAKDVATRATEKASTAEKQASLAKETADSATQLAAKLQYRQSRRELTTEGRVAIVNDLSKYAGQKFNTVLRNPGDPESASIANDIRIALGNAGWVIDDRITSLPVRDDEIKMRFRGRVADIFTSMSPPGTLPPFDSAANDLGRILKPTIFAESEDVPEGTIVAVINPRPPDIETQKRMLEQLAKTKEQWPINDSGPTFALDEFRGQRYRLYAPVNDIAAEGLQEKISWALGIAGWKRTNKFIEKANYPTNFGNVLVAISPADAENFPRSACALLNELKRLGIVGENESLRVIEQTPAGEIAICIGLNPSMPAHKP